MYVVPIEQDGMSKEWLRLSATKWCLWVFAFKSVVAFSVWICLSCDSWVLIVHEKWNVIYACVPVVVYIVVNEPRVVITIPWWHS